MNTKAALPYIVLLVVGLVFAATLLAASYSSRHHTVEPGSYSYSGEGKTYEKSYSVSPGEKLVVDADEGEILITGTDKQEVSVRVTIRGTDQQVKRFTVNSWQDAGIVKVEGRSPRRYWNFFGNNNPDVRFEIDVPKEFNASLQTAGGNIVVMNLKGTLDGETSGGDLELTQLDGTVRMSTSGGNVSLKTATGEFRVSTSGGNIDGEDVIGPVNCRTSGGNIELRNVDGQIYASTSGGDIRASLKDNKGIECSTSGGNVRVRLPKTIAADLNAEASGGDVNCDFSFNGTHREGKMKGKINGGGNLIKLETSGGEISLTEAE